MSWFFIFSWSRFFLQSLFYTHMSMLNTINKHGGRRMHTTNEWKNKLIWANILCLKQESVRQTWKHENDFDCKEAHQLLCEAQDRVMKVGSEMGEARVCHHLAIPQEMIIDQTEKMIKAMKSRMAQLIKPAAFFFHLKSSLK